jgi:hypothetical protein
MRVHVVGIVEGGKWAQVQLPDKRVAYFPASDLDLGQPAAQPTEAQAPPPPAVPDDGPPVEFEPVSEVYTVDKSVTVYVEPNTLAPQRYEIDAGTSIPAVARSKDGTWVRASTEDGQPAFLKVADLGAPQSGKAVVAPLDDSALNANAQNAIEGEAKVVTTSQLEITGKTVDLVGIQGDNAQPFVQALQDFINKHGTTLHCDQQPDGYLCKSADGTDIGLSALSNGWARAKKDAASQYQTEAAAAQQAGRGVWHQ